jgi:hypothetical protein
MEEATVATAVMVAIQEWVVVMVAMAEWVHMGLLTVRMEG